MLIWQLSAPSSAFPSLASPYLMDEIALAPCLLFQECTKAEFSSDLFRISTIVGEGQRLCKFCIIHDKKKKKRENKQSKQMKNSRIKHYTLLRFANAVTFLCAALKRANFRSLLSALHVDESYNFSCFSKLLLTVLSVYLDPQGAHRNLRERLALSQSQHKVSNSSGCRCTPAFYILLTDTSTYSSKEYKCDGN